MTRDPGCDRAVPGGIGHTPDRDGNRDKGATGMGVGDGQEPLAGSPTPR